jgi:hypothetical protein
MKTRLLLIAVLLLLPSLNFGQTPKGSKPCRHSKLAKFLAAH